MVVLLPSTVPLVLPQTPLLMVSPEKAESPQPTEAVLTPPVVPDPKSNQLSSAKDQNGNYEQNAKATNYTIKVDHYKYIYKLMHKGVLDQRIKSV